MLSDSHKAYPPISIRALGVTEAENARPRGHKRRYVDE